jgi:hypothetical protein
MESRQHCAYNQTRECFLGLEIEVADLPYTILDQRIAMLNLKPGTGLWIAPFRGIPATRIRVPLDLIYLDEDGRVLDVIEFFPTLYLPPSSPQVASVLALPTHSIYSSHTQAGDQMLICKAEEMEHCMERFIHPSYVAGAVQSAVLMREKPLCNSTEELSEWENRFRKDSPITPKIQERGLIEPRLLTFNAPQSWLDRWLSPPPPPPTPPDQRKAPREKVSGLHAHYWTGAAPQAHTVKDISATGLYLITEDRWYPGTLVLMSLQETGCEEDGTQDLLSVYSKVVRWGANGVGLQFVLQDDETPKQAEHTAVVGMNKQELELFLRRLRKQES